MSLTCKRSPVIVQILQWLRELNALQLQKTHSNRKITSKSRKHFHQFDGRWCKCSQHKQINVICSAFLVLWAFAACVLSNWGSRFFNLQVFFLFAARWALSATVKLFNLEQHTAKTAYIFKNLQYSNKKACVRLLRPWRDAKHFSMLKPIFTNCFYKIWVLTWI